MTTITGTRSWQLTWGEHVWMDSDVTGAHAALMSLLAQVDSYSILDPLSGPMALMANIAAYVALADKRDPLEVMAELSAAPLDSLLAAVTMI